MQQTKRFPIGAHLMVKHFGYTHHGIYAGRGRVIHYSGFAHLFKKRPIEITSIEKFSHGKAIHVQHYDSAKYKGRKVVRRMRSRMHENNYHLIINNCEHLCTWAITGVESSPQVIYMMNRLTTIGYISSMMSFMNSMFLTLTTTSFALALYIKKKLRDKANLRLQQYRELQDQAKTKVSDLTNLKHR
ncbi:MULTISPECIES: lecithin retinol acyltransferase family protein [Acinetobacter]|uniref:Phosphatidylcholine--retinol O-acyltransferase n=2 Tax=Acinetobacter pseudolwoffii TaxID=2053287 RepID=A0A2H9YRX8_9GAMM|nr:MULTISPECIES: lecithin retinol acyltransferase family protein [Acinetobacter]NLZ86874.1 lecithin retinol acyltransferase family protein [Gammaproteobacteria bacterium]MCO8091630.1 lecithin retinol acyltransferase family protein [Acinetobacter pseudolwoffii]MCP0910573.1 lecithin retinol acyltransferase family protein [Acinetobacter pseudolwoffii]MDH5819033.1 lecithin retinol acyltransferase family protein [Acinetobacter pseudolwoffii]MDM1324228.1 lecithin retinol acyltransferase family prote